MNQIRTFVLVLAAMASSLAMGQQHLLYWGMESRHVTPNDLLNGTYVGIHEGLDCWVFAGKKNLKHLVMTDQHLETLNVVDLPASNNARVLTAALDDHRASIVVLDESQKRQTTILSYKVNLDSLTVIGGAADTIGHFQYGKKDKCMVWATTSPNGSLIGIIAIVQYNETKQYRTVISLHNADMTPLWEKEFALGSMHDIFVTDQGRIVTLGAEADGAETHFIYNIISQEKSVSYDATVRTEPVRNLKLVNVIGSHIISTGLFKPMEMDDDTLQFGGTIAMSFDADSALITGYVLNPFQNEDVNILYNKKTKRVQREQTVRHMKPVAYAPTSFGAVMAVGRNYIVDVQASNGQHDYTYHTVGLHCIAVDSLGHLLWVRNFRRNDIQDDEDDLLRVGLAEHDGKVCIVKSEHPKYPAIYDIAKDVKEWEAGDKSSLVLYTIDADKNVEKTILERKAKHTFLRAITRPDGSLALFGCNGKKSRMGIVNSKE